MLFQNQNLTMDIIIFSYNRALQAKTLIESIFNYMNPPQYNIHVIYNSSNEDYQMGYDYIIKQYSNKVNFYKEEKQNNHYSLSEIFDFYNFKLLFLCPFLRGGKTNFREKLIEICRNSHDEIMFLTDDSVFIDNVSISNEILAWIHQDPWHRQISLRVGHEFITKEIDIEKGNCWSFEKHLTNSIWGYRYSLDAHIYDAKTITSFLRKATFKNPNTLESVGMLHSVKKGLFENGLFLDNVKILSYPINIVQNTFKNEALHANTETLNNYLLKGFELILPKPEKITEFQIYPDEIQVKKDSIIKTLKIK